MTVPNDATSSQIRAADPRRSTWVSANAGSGKTKVLTDRVARLLLNDVPPRKILCLTYTKAAAAHMQIKLFERLGAWSMLPDERLAKELVDLGESPSRLSPEVLRKARTLFARALETPGGLKIQTIHSFCSALLRRFPVEAGVSPQFQEMDERSATLLRADILEELASNPDSQAFDAFARQFTAADPAKLIAEITSHREAFLPPKSRAAIWQSFGLPADYTPEQYLAEVFPPDALATLTTLFHVLGQGSKTDVANQARIAPLLTAPLSMNTAEVLEGVFVYGAKTKKAGSAKFSTFPTKKLRDANPALMEDLHPLMRRFEAARPRRLGLKAACRTLALHDFARAFLPAYERAKQARGWLDFDDLILKAHGLLTDSSMAQWVLYRLDEGIDHILVDEAQDTSASQWKVIARLAAEFTAGDGARQGDRTIFVVGDEKQSIYSFQGADPAAFEQMRDQFAQRLEEVRTPLNRGNLLYSFRSSGAILQLVDVVLEQSNGATLAANVRHLPFHAELAGRVDLWDFRARPEKSEPPAWYEPVDTPRADDPNLLLAEDIASSIAGILESRETLPTKTGTRPIHAGDFLILVQRRSDLFRAIIKSLKARGLPVAGADRLRIGGELAVRDLTSFLSFMATPEDDLSLAEVLRSPLAGLSEDALFRLAHPRKGFLWQALRAQKAAHGDIIDMFDDMLARADYLRPYELLERILTHHAGRDKLIARLGKEAEEGIDALLAQALQYEQVEAPTLTGFLGWMQTDESEIKRQMDTESTEIRVMTVHGAKGLESPIVILPDTAKRDDPGNSEVQMLADGLAAWKVTSDENPDVLRDAMADQKAFLAEERLRLLYVALTRAESWLIVCGAGDRGAERESWFDIIARGVTEMGAVRHSFQGREILRYQPFPWDVASSASPPAVAVKGPDLPGWATQPAADPAQPEPVLSPSKLGGDKIVAGATEGESEEAALRRGRLLHLLLEHLPAGGTDPREELAGRILAMSGESPDAQERAALLAEAESVLDNPELARLFSGPALAEVPLSGECAGTRYYGVIDRLIVKDEMVLAVDFKSNREVPDAVGDVPEGLLRQMGAYAAMLANIYPNHEIRTALLWTRKAELMVLPHNIVTDAFQRAPTS